MALKDRCTDPMHYQDESPGASVTLTSESRSLP